MGKPTEIFYSHYVPTLEEQTLNQLQLLQLQLDESIEVEDYMEAACIKRQMDALNNQQQPTH